MTNPLEVRGLTAGYGKVMILQDIDLTLGDGEIVCVAGPNGAGKSTLLKAVTGVIPWTEGTVSIYGTEAKSGESQDLARESIGVVPQVSNVFPSLSVHENLLTALPRKWHKGRKADALARTYDSFDTVRESRRAMGYSLSGGQRQALAFAMATIREPKVLLLDEPTAALAPNTAQLVFKRIVDLKKTGIPILLVEQNVRLAMDISDRAYFFENGQNALDGDAAELKDDPRIRKVYLGGS